jgi:hypothetical protein
MLKSIEDVNEEPMLISDSDNEEPMQVDPLVDDLALVIFLLLQYQDLLLYNMLWCSSELY